MVQRPDGFHAWVIALSGCLINMILSGISRMVGFLYIYVVQQYGVSRKEAAFPFVIRNSVRSLSGPLVGIVAQRYGIRTVTFIGGLMAAAGAALCFIAPNVTWLAILWGGLHGAGFAFANTLFQVVVNQYFEKYRATASGIALSGACIGSLGFPIMIETFLNVYGLAGGFLLLGGVTLHVLPPSLLLKSPPWVTNPEQYAKQLALQVAEKEAKLDGCEESKTTVTVPEERAVDWARNDLIRQPSFSSNPVDELVFVNQSHIGDPVSIFSQVKDGRNRETRDELNVVCTLYRGTSTPIMKKKQISSAIEGDHSGQNQKTATLSERVSVEASSCHETRPKTDDTRQTCLESCRTIVRLYTNPVYVLISVCMSTYVIIFIPILTVIVDYSKDKGFSDVYGKYLINALAIGDLIGRLGFGWVTDRGFMTIPAFMTLMLMLQGVLIVLFPFTNTIWIFMTVLVLYGIAAGSMLVLFPVLVLKYVESNIQAVAMSCVGFLSGLVSICIPPLIGHFRDDVGSYDGMFYLTGGLSVLSGGLWLLEPIIVRLYYGEDYQEKIKNKSFFKKFEVSEKKPS